MNDYIKNTEETCYYENEGTTVAQVRRNIGRVIANAIRKKRPILHISHADLDGYGCSHLLDTLPQFLAPVTAYGIIRYYGDMEYNRNNINITHYNTNKLNNSLFEVLDPIAYGFHTGIWSTRNLGKTEDGPYVRPLLIITDISGFDLEQLILVYGVEYDIIVIDHHQWTPELKTSEYYEKTNSKTSITEALVTWRSWDLSGCTDSRTEIALTASTYDPKLVRKEDEVRVQVYICSDHSATKLLMDIMSELLTNRIKRQEANSKRTRYDRVEEFDWCKRSLRVLQTIADLVSKYDTGDFGNWYISEGGDDHVSMQTALNEMIRSVGSTKSIYSSKAYSSWMEMSDNIYSKQKMIFEQFAYLIRYGWAVNSANPMAERGDGIHTEGVMRRRMSCEELMIKVQERFTRISRDYDIWASTIVPLHVDSFGTAYILPTYNDTKVKSERYVNKFDSLTPGKYLVRIASEDEKYPMSIYAQRLLKESADTDFFVEFKEKDDTIVVSLRSVKENANCVKIAVANGGGGHIHAAGFTLK